MDSPGSTTAPVDGKRPLLERVLDRVFRCSHRHQALPITLKGETFRICLDCGSHVPYSLEAWQSGKPVKEPGNQAARPVPKPSEPATKATQPVTKALEPVSKATQPIPKALEPVNKSKEATNKPTQPVIKSTEPAAKPKEPVAKTKEPVNKSKAPVNQSPAPPKQSAANPSASWARSTLSAWSREGIWLGLLAIGFAGGIYYSNQQHPAPANRVNPQPPPKTAPAPVPPPVPILSPAPAATQTAVADTRPALAVRRPNQTPHLQGERGFVLLAREPADALKLSKHPGSLGSLISTGGLFTVPRGTAVRVVSRQESVVQVVILEGPIKGDEGWVAAARLSTE